MINPLPLTTSATNIPNPIDSAHPIDWAEADKFFSVMAVGELVANVQRLNCVMPLRAAQ